jgi:hypothetical protein
MVTLHLFYYVARDCYITSEGYFQIMISLKVCVMKLKIL